MDTSSSSCDLDLRVSVDIIFPQTSQAEKEILRPNLLLYQINGALTSLWRADHVQGHPFSFNGTKAIA